MSLGSIIFSSKNFSAVLNGDVNELSLKLARRPVFDEKLRSAGAAAHQNMKQQLYMTRKVSQ